MSAVSLLYVFWCTPLASQWLAAVEVGAERFWGGSVENTPEHRSFRPYRPTVFGLGLEHRSERLGLGLRLRYMAAALGLEGRDAVAAVDGVFEVFSASPEVIYRLARIGRDNPLSIRAGPLFEIWSIMGGDSKTLIGIQGALSLSVPLGTRLAGSVLAEVAVSPSPFARDQLDQGFEPRALWRRGVAARLEYRLGARSRELGAGS
jgi:hypothetical protein